MIWTDENGVVERIHHNTSELSDDRCDGIEVESIPDPDPPKHYYENVLIYDGSSLHYDYRNPFEGIGVDLSESDKEEAFEKYARGEQSIAEAAAEIAGDN